MQNNRLNALHSMLQNQPDDPFLIYAIGVEYESGGETERALANFNRLLADFPKYLPTYYKTGLLLFEMGQNKKALEILENGIRLAIEMKENKTLRELKEAVQMVEDEM